MRRMVSFYLWWWEGFLPGVSAFSVKWKVRHLLLTVGAELVKGLRREMKASVGLWGRMRKEADKGSHRRIAWRVEARGG